MILKNDTEKKFILTKSYNVPYLLHSYCNNNLKNEKLKNIVFTQIEWDNENLELNLLNDIMKITKPRRKNLIFLESRNL